MEWGCGVPVCPIGDAELSWGAPSLGEVVPLGLGGRELSGDHGCGERAPNWGGGFPDFGVCREPGRLGPHKRRGVIERGSGRRLGSILRGCLSGLGLAGFLLLHLSQIPLDLLYPALGGTAWGGIAPRAGGGAGPVGLKAFNAIKTSGLGSQELGAGDPAGWGGRPQVWGKGEGWGGGVTAATPRSISPPHFAGQGPHPRVGPRASLSLRPTLRSPGTGRI